MIGPVTVDYTRLYDAVASVTAVKADNKKDVYYVYPPRRLALIKTNQTCLAMTMATQILPKRMWVAVRSTYVLHRYLNYSCRQQRLYITELEQEYLIT